MGIILLPIATRYTGTGASTFGAHLYADGTVLVSGQGALQPVQRGLVTYWAGSPAVVGLTDTAFGAANAGLKPGATPLNALQTLLLQTASINLLLGQQPTYYDQFVAQ